MASRRLETNHRPQPGHFFLCSIRLGGGRCGTRYPPLPIPRSPTMVLPESATIRKAFTPGSDACHAREKISKHKYVQDRTPVSDLRKSPYKTRPPPDRQAFAQCLSRSLSLGLALGFHHRPVVEGERLPAHLPPSTAGGGMGERATPLGGRRWKLGGRVGGRLSLVGGILNNAGAPVRW